MSRSVRRGAEAYEELPHIDERLEVHGLTDRDPEFFEKQAAREAPAADPLEVLGRGLPAAPLDRMLRPRRRKGGGA